MMSFRVGEEYLNMLESDRYAFEDLKSRIYRASAWSDKFSESFVSNLLRDIVGKLHGTGDLQAAMCLLKEEDRKYGAFDGEHDAFIPLVGLKIALPEFKVGQVVLVELDESLVQARLGRNASNHFGRFVLNSLSNSAMAKFRVTAEAGLLRNEGLRKHAERSKF